MYDINSIDQIITELGGPSELGEHLGITQEAVSNWSARGAIPRGWHLQLFAMVIGRGLSISPTVFNLSEQEAEGLFTRPLARRRQAIEAGV